jgi:RNase P subunit RPR2
MSFVTSALAALNCAFKFIQGIHSLAIHLVFHISSKKVVQKGKIRKTRGPYNWSSSSYPLTWEIHFQTVMENVRKMNRCTVQLKNKIVVAELWKSIICQNCSELIACNDVLIKEKWTNDSFMCECASHVHFRTPIHVLNVLWEAHCPK